MDNKTITPEQFARIRTTLGMSQQEFSVMLGYKNMMSVSMKETNVANITQRDMLLLKPYLYILQVPANFVVSNTLKVIDMHVNCFSAGVIKFLKKNAVSYVDQNKDTCEDIYGVLTMLCLIDDGTIKKPAAPIMEELGHIATVLNSTESPYLRIIKN